MTKIKKSAFAFGAACALALTGGLTALKTLPAAADGETATRGHYGTPLTGVAGAFYDELVEMTKTSTVTEEDETETTVPSKFSEGKPSTVTNSDIITAAAAYEGGDTTLVKAFGAALDCFRYDYVDLFYINFDALNFTVTKVADDVAEGNPQTYTYGVTIGAQDYLLANDVAAKITAYDAKINEYKNDTELAALSTAEQVVSVSKSLGEKLTYEYGNFAGTAYSIVEGKANSEGAARAFKAVMNSLGVTCELVSGYFVQNGVIKAWTWNYVEDGGSWYAVDVAANLVTKSEKYVNLTAAEFNLDHYEDKVVSLSKHELGYPTLTTGTPSSVDTGALEIEVEENVSYGEGESAKTATAAFSYEGKELDNLRIKVNGEWQTIAEYMAEANKAPEEGGESVENVKIDETEQKVYFFVLTKSDFELAEADASGKRIIPLADVDVKAASVEIEYSEALTKIEEADIVIDVTVETLNGEKVEGVNCTIGKGTLSTDGLTVTFDFTPSKELKHNAVRYIFTPTNLAATKTVAKEPEEEGGAPTTEEVADTDTVLKSYSYVYRFQSIVAEKVYGGSEIPSDIVVKPTLAFNNELSLDGWTYGDNKPMDESMKSSLTLAVTKPTGDDSTKIETAANGIYTEAGAVKKVEPYNVGLTLDGQAVNVGNSYVKLAFPYPADCIDTTGVKTDVVFKVLQFKRDADGAIDYENATVVDAVATRQGIIAAVNGLDAFAVVVLDKTAAGDVANEKAILTQTSGVGGTVTVDGNKTVNTLKDGDEITYTFTHEEGYKVGYATIDGEDITELIADNKITVKYTDLVDKANSNAPVMNNVLQVVFVKDDENADAVIAAAKGFTENTVGKQLDTTGYTSGEISGISSVVYPTGSIVIGSNTSSGEIPPPVVNDPTDIDTASSKMAMIIILSIVGGLVLVGIIAIVYCGAIRPKILREREEEAERIAAQRERRANRNKMRSGSSYNPRSKV